jgi:hypothetical protein
MLHQVISNKDFPVLIKDIKEKAGDYSFIVRNVFDMAEDFSSHGVDVDENFEVPVHQ